MPNSDLGCVHLQRRRRILTRPGARKMQKQHGVSVVRDFEGALQVWDRGPEISAAEVSYTALFQAVDVFGRQIDRDCQAADGAVEITLAEIGSAKLRMGGCKTR